MFIMIVRQFIDVLKALSLNLTMRETEIFAQSYVTYKLSQFLHLHLFFLDVHIRFSSQCEFTCYWSSVNKQ